MKFWSTDLGPNPISPNWPNRNLARNKTKRMTTQHPKTSRNSKSSVARTRGSQKKPAPQQAAGTVRVAAIQMASGPNVVANLAEAERLIEQVAEAGARLVALPEYFAIMGMKDTDKVKVREKEGRGPMQDFLSR